MIDCLDAVSLPRQFSSAGSVNISHALCLLALNGFPMLCGINGRALHAVGNPQLSKLTGKNDRARDCDTLLVIR